MKHTLLFLFVFLCGFNLSAQDFSIAPSPIVVNNFYDLTDDFYIVHGYSTFTNNTTEDVTVRWELTEVSAPDSWQSQVCDKNACYAFGQYTNIGGVSSLDQPLVVAAGGTSNLDLGTKYVGSAGVGTFEIKVTTVEDTSVVLASNTIELRVNVNADGQEIDAEGNVITTSISEIEKANLKVFPNPTVDYFTITDNTVVRGVEIFNIVGKRMTSISFTNGKAVNVASLPNGLYLIRMLDEDQQILKTTRLTKR